MWKPESPTRPDHKRPAGAEAKPRATVRAWPPAQPGVREHVICDLSHDPRYEPISAE